MNDDLLREQWARYLGGEALSDDERRELLEALRQNPTLREEMLRDVQLHGLMRSMGNVGKDAGEFAESFQEFMENERDGSRFIKMVSSRIRKDEPAPSRTKRRPLRREGPSTGSPWIWALCAAGLLVAVLALVSRPTDPPDTRPSAAERRRTLAEERAAAEAQRRQAEERKAAIEKKQEQLAQPPVAPPADPKAEEARQIERARLAKEREQAEQELRDAIARAQKANEELKTIEKPPPAPVPQEKPAPRNDRQDTRTVVATLGKTEGVVLLENRTPAAAGLLLHAGQSLETGEAGVVEIHYADRTRVDVAAGTQVHDFKTEGGKRFRLSKGSVRADVMKQPRGQPMVIETPHGLVTVLGTTLRLIVEPGDAGFTRLEVEEGKVQLKNLAGKTVEVISGHHAVAAVGTELVSRSLVPETLALSLMGMKGMVGINFGPADSLHPDGFLGDSGGLFDAKRGYGWKEPIVQVHNRMDGPRPQMTRMPSRSLVVKDPLRDNHMAVGWKDITQTWTMTIPNGRYLVTVCVGQPAYQQGPHHVWIEGVQAIDAAVTRAAEFVEKTVRVDVKDYELTVRVGGSGKDFDGTSDTVLCFLVVRKAER